MGQFLTPSGDKQQKAQVADLLKQARRAMKSKDFATADRKIAQADAFRLKYGAFHIADTPTKARRDLWQLQQDAQSGTTSAAQRLLSALPSFGRKTDDRATDRATDPFAGRNRTSPTATAPRSNSTIPGAFGTSGRNDSTAFLSPSRGGQNPEANYRFADRAAPTSHPGASRFADTNARVPRTEVRSKTSRTPPPLVANSTRNRFGDAKSRAASLVSQARRAIAAGDLRSAQQLAMQADRMNVPDSAYRRGEDRPADVLWELRNARSSSQVRLAGGASQPKTAASRYPAARAIYDRNNDRTRNVRMNAQGTDRRPSTRRGSARDLYDQGTRALYDHDKNKALGLFRQAWKQRGELDDITLARLQERLQMLSAPSAARSPNRSGSDIDIADASQRVLFKKLESQLMRSQAQANDLRERDSQRAVAVLSDARANIQNSNLAPNVRGHLLRRADMAMDDMDRYIDSNRNQIEFRDRNRNVKAQVERERAHVLEVREEIAMLVDQFNTKVDEKSYHEAMLISKRLRAIAPENEPVALQVLRQAQLLYNLQRMLAIREAKADGFLDAMGNVDESAIPFDDNRPIQYGKDWNQLSSSRERRRRERGRRRSPQELEIIRSLSQPVSVRFNRRPLGEVMDDLAALTNVNLFLDPQGLDQEGVSIDEPVTINLRKEISLKSALMLILEPLNLSYVVRDEVLKITSERLRDGDVYIETYDVGDLVMPIPNFAPGGVGIQQSLDRSYASLAGGLGMSPGVSVSASPHGIAASGQINPAIRSQMNAPAGGGAFGGPGGGFGGGPGGLGGGSRPDFDSLIDLIQQTIEPTSWDEVGGPGTVAGHDTNLSLVISQTQEVHEQIVDLLEQLRRLQDLQVTIEVRFITLNDNFFERIGIDFDFHIDDNVTLAAIPDDNGPSVTFGLGPDGQPTADLDIQFNNGSFGAALPAFGGFDATSAASFGFAILSDIEAFFFIQAAQGDNRTNIMQAPKVTLFNGQQAFVSDTTQMPFVISLIPVVGDFAAAHQPVIVVLSEGTFMTVQAVVSNDRRYVRLTIVPFFSKIGPVSNFTFSSERVSSRTTDDDADPNTAPAAEDIIAATTVQLPSFSFVTVTTTVSVPDGGTVLLGGIKRLSEGRNELGVPMLNKIPYINRLFKNIGIGKSTQSLMMMVTPRIIIQEEEEAKLGIAAP
jgi:general secretion pathway protein D